MGRLPNCRPGFGWKRWTSESTHLGRQLLQGSDVHDPDGPAVGSGNEVPVSGMDLQVMDGNRGKALHELLPVSAHVGGHVQPNVGAHEEEVRVHQVLTNHMDEVGLPGGQIAGDGAEALPAVGGHVHVGREVVGPVPVEGYEEGVHVVAGGFDPVGPRSRRERPGSGR